MATCRIQNIIRWWWQISIDKSKKIMRDKKNREMCMPIEIIIDLVERNRTILVILINVGKARMEALDAREAAGVRLNSRGTRPVRSQSRAGASCEPNPKSRATTDVGARENMARTVGCRRVTSALNGR